ncbi:FAD-dependent oxidoreductase [uncultured Pseudosulfitobacter sp.]|jgi:D-amino-acid dehydrogenase|uniref:NAD(P)/FAD-dependent oxidoreductase n=1 Tax=uncultured Pseudosulfitobacter sp. TaxID=2854214 RepID=UPI0030DC6667|tara:strand:+ start:33982 stop:35202 length:1221 start_codon:yes stop_codon:yes gene_type:complete
MADFLVLGAGMVGIGAALALQAQGHAVRVIDQRGPGEETSHGNAGVIQAEARAPYAMPRDLATLLRYGLGRSNDFRLDPTVLPGSARALLDYFRHSAPARHAQVIPHYAALVARATADHGTLVADAGADALIRRTGLGEIYETAQDFDARAQTATDFAETHGLALRCVDGSDLRSEEPALTRSPAGAIVWDESWSTSDPGALVRAYAKLFETRGGTILQSAVHQITETITGWRVDRDGGHLSAEHLVVALGPWSPALLKHLGYRVPMVMKRGYHGHYDMQGNLARPYLLADHGVVMSTMARGLRITTGAHLARTTAPQNLAQLTHGAAAAGALVGLNGPVPDSQWQGVRPCLPRMLPMVGRAPRHEKLWFNFGHGHQGLTLGPTTGALLADIVDGRDDALTQALAP